MPTKWEKWQEFCHKTARDQAACATRKFFKLNDGRLIELGLIYLPDHPDCWYTCYNDSMFCGNGTMAEESYGYSNGMTCYSTYEYNGNYYEPINLPRWRSYCAVRKEYLPTFSQAIK